MESTEISRAPLKASPSLLPNNLTVSDRYLAYTQLSSKASTIHLVRADKLVNLVSSDYSVASFRSDEPIFSLNFVQIETDYLLVVCCASRTSILDSECRKEIFAIESNIFGHGAEADNFYFKGCAATQSSLAIGCSQGVVGLFIAERSIRGIMFRHHTILAHSNTPISAIGMVHHKVVIGDEEGNLSFYFWDTRKNAWDKQDPIGGAGLPVTSICINTDICCVANANGCVSVYTWVDSKAVLAFDIWAHCRWLNAAAFLSQPLGGESYGLLTCGEDTYVNLWSVSKTQAQLELSKCVENSVFTGVVGLLGVDRAAVVAYDQKEIGYFKTF
mmetsp:Transcript_8398/g.16725  ORF Transcript_8398/g.16725 Transcript_8398/m.16725 type:complete len:330 (-) Transcript_8398:9-998(-)